MALIIFFSAPIFFAVIFLSATFYYRSKVIRCQERLQRMWVDTMLSNSSPAQRKESLDLFFDGKDNHFRPLRTAEENKVKSP